MIERTCEVDGHGFELTFKQQGSSTQMYLEARDAADTVLAKVVESGVAMGVERFSQALEERSGRDWDGEVGFAYPEEDDSIPEGCVSLYFRDLAGEVEEKLFRQAGLLVAKIYREVSAELRRA